MLSAETSRGIDQLANIFLLFSEDRGLIMVVSLRTGQGLQSRNHIALRAQLVKKSGNDALFSYAGWLSSHRIACWVRNDTARNSSGESDDGATLRRRNAGRLFYRTALLQTRFQILGLYSAARTAVE